ncbi:hypothetical protein U875_26350 [Pandoraea pnomenusa 3kgm]|nr:hypothetical protein U875_26350 [Pandoraea pnomenusa 3kgm]
MAPAPTMPNTSMVVPEEGDAEDAVIRSVSRLVSIVVDRNRHAGTVAPLDRRRNDVVGDAART